MRTTTLGALATILCFSLACGNPSEESLATPGGGLVDPELVIAETRLGPITAADLDRYVLALPPNLRSNAADEEEEWYGSIARRIASDRLLLDEARLVGADQDPQFKLLERRIERNATSDFYLSGLPPLQPISMEEAREVYDANLAKYQREEKRRVSHIYKRFGPDMDRDKAEEELQEIRRRLLAGESFDLLAREHSDSETRHNGGLIGEIGRGQFTEDFDGVVFALAERQPSEPVVTSDGVHIFQVWDILEERSFGFDEVRPSIVQELEAERRAERLREAAAALPQPQESLTLDRKEIAEILRLGDPATVILRLGDFAMSIGQFQEVLQSERRLLGAKHTPDLPFQLLEEMRNREIIYQHLRSEGVNSGANSGADSGADSVPQEQLKAERDRELALYFARRKMTSWVERRPEIVQRHYDNNRMRFASPLRLHLRVLSIPIVDNGLAVMADLEQARADLDAGTRQLEDLATAHGGEVKDLGFASAAQVQATAPKALRFVFLLKPGEHTPPYARGNALVMFQVLERQDPQPRALALVRDRVVQDYLTNYSPSVFEKLSTEMLEEAEFKIHNERLARL